MKFDIADITSTNTNGQLLFIVDLHVFNVINCDDSILTTKIEIDAWDIDEIMNLLQSQNTNSYNIEKYDDFIVIRNNHRRNKQIFVIDYVECELIAFDYESHLYEYIDLR